MSVDVDRVGRVTHVTSVYQHPDVNMVSAASQVSVSVSQAGEENCVTSQTVVTGVILTTVTVTCLASVSATWDGRVTSVTRVSLTPAV